MKNIKIHFGYNADNWLAKFSYWLCSKFTFIPTFDINLFTTYYKTNKPFIKRHSITIGIFSYMGNWSKVNGKWKYEKY